MYTERLLLEVQASRVGWTTIKPPLVKGTSGTLHSFSFLASSGAVLYGFDFYDTVTEIEVLKSYIKSFDTGTGVQIVVGVGKATEKAKALAREYGMRMLLEEEIRPYFAPRAAWERIGAE